MSEFLHQVVKKRERDEEYRTLRIQPPGIRLPDSILSMLARDMEESYARLVDTQRTGDVTIERR